MVNSAYLFMVNDGQIAAEDRDVANLLLDILESWIRGNRFIIKKENIGPKMVDRQREFFTRSEDLEDLLIMILSGQVELDAGKRLCDAATRSLEAWLRVAK